MTSPEGRCAATTAASSGGRDAAEEAHWRRLIAGPYRLEELFQPAMTHASAAGRSRLDRIYTSQHLSDQLDRQVRSAALEWVPHLSAHRAVAIVRNTTTRSVDPEVPPAAGFQHPDWATRASAEYHRLLDEEPGLSEVGRLGALRRAMCTAAANVVHPVVDLPADVTLEDRLGLTMRFLRALEHNRPGVIGHCLTRYPALASLVPNPYAPLGGGPAHFRRVQEHARELARDHALDELGKLHEDLATLDEPTAMLRRQRNLRLLYRLAPGRAAGIQAVRDPNGEIRTDPHGMG